MHIYMYIYMCVWCGFIHVVKSNIEKGLPKRSCTNKLEHVCVEVHPIEPQCQQRAARDLAVEDNSQTTRI